MAEDVIEEEDNTYCEICGRADREDRMLLCDSCDLGSVNTAATQIVLRRGRWGWFLASCVRVSQIN